MIRIDYLSSFCHNKVWYEENKNHSDEDLIVPILKLNEKTDKSGLGVLMNVVKMALGKNNETRLLQYVKMVGNPKLKFLQDLVAGMSSSGISSTNLLQRILEKGYQVWMF